MSLIEVAVEAARAAGAEINQRLPQDRDIRTKGFRDLVTDADVAAQDQLVAVIKGRFPHHGICSEEGLQAGDQGTVWVLDPLDGTTNYAHRYPAFSVAIGVVQDGELVVGVVYDPVRQQLFAAERGAGARLNGDTLRVSQTQAPIDALVALDFAREPAARAAQMAAMVRVSTHISTFRSCGSAALSLCYVAAGWLDAYFHCALCPWDVAGPAVILAEAGGQLTALDGAPWHYQLPSCLASNRVLHAGLLDALRT